MPENSNNPQSKGIGELFIEFGTKGLPKLLKNLNSVSASFLLGKNAASQFAQALTKPFKEAGNTAVSIGKMSNALGTTYKEYQRLVTYMKSKNVSEGLVGDVQNLQTALYNFHTGMDGLPAGFSTAFSKLGLDIGDYLGDFESIMQLFDDMRSRTTTMSKQEKNQIFNLLGISRDWGYLWSRGDFNLRDANLLSDEEVEKNIKAQESFAELSLALKNLGETIVTRIAPPVIEIANFLTKWITGVKKDENKTNDVAAITTGAVVGFGVAGIPGAVMGAAVMKEATKREKLQKSLGGTKGNYVPAEFGAKQLDFGTAPWIKKDEGSSTGGAAGLENNDGYMGSLPDLTPKAMLTPNAVQPSDMNSIVQNITINNQNNITGDNAREIAGQITRINAQDIEYTQYQLQNLPGL